MDDIRPPQNQINNQQNPSAPPPDPQPTYQPQPQPPENLSPSPYGNSPQVNFNQPKPKRRKLRALMWLLVIALLAAGGWFAYQKYFQDKPEAPTVQSKEIDQINVGLYSADLGGLYPEMSANSYSILSNAQVFEGLVRYENKSKIVPLLATDWSNPDSKTWVFNLRNDVKFHDANSMQADDVKYSIEKIKKIDNDYASIFASTIDKVTVKDDYQVEITTLEPDPTLLNKLAFLYIIDAQAPKDSEPSQAGTGPYTVKPGTEPTPLNLQLVAYDDYHGGKPKTRAVNFNIEKTLDDLVKAYQEGKYNIADIPVNKAESVSSKAQFVTNEPEIAYLGLNTVKTGPLKKKEVREAIRHAVDPVALGATLDDKVTPLSQLIPGSIPGYNPAIPTYERDVAKAKDLLAKAGYPNGVKIRFAHSSSDKLAKELVRQLKEAGITLEVDFHSDFDEYIDYFSSGKAEMYYIIYASDILDGLDMYQTTLPPEYYKDAELDKVLAEAGKTVDSASRLKLLQEAAVIIDKDVAAVPLSTQDTLWQLDKEYDLVQDMPSSYLSVYFYKVQLK